MAKPDNNKTSSILSSVYSAFLGSESALRRYLGRFLYRQEDIDDMVQETFLRAYRATRQRDIEFPKAYLFRVAKSVAMRELGRKAHQMTDYLEEAAAEEAPQPGSLEEHLQAEQTIQLYCNAIAELPPQCRRVFLMRKYQALSHKEIARELNISVGAVEKQVTLGIRRCMTYMEKQEAAADSSLPPAHQEHSHD
ncbi:RNA polymerase sigma factor [Oceanicoccus sagamiensis]|uniref:RNA polymerase sigma factor n=1 Tax=Oceanicoccus sagamiensis TaxID=716816 RepID=UPI00146B64A2|nr:RNA polymerase sigma factor [Oceanicoccus sagamiensis]